MQSDKGAGEPGFIRKAIAWLAGGASAVFLANLPGLPPEIPDLLPVVGNLDELAASVVLLWATQTLGVSPRRWLQARRHRNALAAAGGSGNSDA